MSERIPAIILNANQRRHFEVLFARLEDSLTKVERLLAPLTDPRHTLCIDAQLRGYGEVDPMVERYLDPALKKWRGC